MTDAIRQELAAILTRADTDAARQADDAAKGTTHAQRRQAQERDPETAGARVFLTFAQIERIRRALYQEGPMTTKPEWVRVAGAGTLTIPLTRAQAAANLAHARQTMMRDASRLLRVFPTYLDPAAEQYTFDTRGTIQPDGTMRYPDPKPR